MTWWSIGGLVGVALAFSGITYILLRWRKAPQAYRAMVVLSVLLAGTLLGGWPVDFTTSSTLNNRVASASPIQQTTSATGRTTARVVWVTDGATVTVAESDGHEDTIRLAGIDAPEHDQAFGAQSTQHIASLISGQSVSLDCGSERSYGRLICKISRYRTVRMWTSTR